MTEGSEPQGTTNARLSRLETKYDDLSQRVSSAIATIEQVAQNQKHAEQINDLRFNGLDTAIKQIGSDLRGFMARIEGIITGEVRLPQSEQIMKDWQDWRATVERKLDTADGKLDEQAVLNGQVKLLGRLAVILVGGNALAIVGVVYALIRQAQP